MQTVHLLSEPDIVFLQSDSIILILNSCRQTSQFQDTVKGTFISLCSFSQQKSLKMLDLQDYNVTTFICSFFTAEILVKYGSTLERDGALHDRQLLCRVYEPAADKSSRQRVIEDATRASREPLPEGMVGSTHVWSRCR